VTPSRRRPPRPVGRVGPTCWPALHWAWQHTSIDHVISLIAPDDRRSIRIATKIGEQFERADLDPANGEPVHVYGIHRQP